MKGITIRDFMGDYALDIPMGEGCVHTIYFNSRRNAETVKRIMEVDDSVPNAATVCDMVEVVRCKDCKYLDRTDCFGECSLFRDRDEPRGEMMPNDFCSYGERKEQNGVQKEETQKRTPTHWTLGWSCTLELGFDDGKYLPRKAAILLYPQYFDEKGEPIKSALPIGRSRNEQRKAD